MFVNETSFILTGAPGVGKTSLLDALEDKYYCIAEPAREVIAEQRLIDGVGTSEQNAELFTELLLSRSIAKFTNEYPTDSIRIFDRGIPDTIAYAASFNLSKKKYENASRLYRYNRKVFLLCPWPEIYSRDCERTMTFEQICVFHELIVQVYRGLDYILVEVPIGTIAERAHFVAANIPKLSERRPPK